MAETAADLELQPVGRERLATRLAIGLAQGVLLLILYRARTELPAATFGALWLAAVLVPIAALGAAGRLPWRPLAAWLAAAAVIALTLGGYDRFVWLGADAEVGPFPSPPLWALTGAALFILHQLIIAAVAEGRWRASYERYFDDGWMDAVRLALAAAFVAALWLLLLLGAELFGLIGLKFVRRLIRQDWFGFPITGAAFAVAVHVTDVRSQMVRGARTLALSLLSWLAPVLTGFAAAFLLALPFTGLAPLWATRSATGTMLAVCAGLVVLINAAYQDGERPGFPPAALKWSVRLAGVVLAPLVVIAAYGLALRIGQYGLSPSRIYVAAALLVAAAYAAGYLWAALTPGPWMKRLEAANWLTAHLAVATFLVVFSPLLDPARLSVADQVRRLERGAVSAATFDYGFLHFGSGRWGRAELARLAAGQSAGADAAVADAARAELKRKNRWDPERVAPGELDVIEAPAGPLPAGFLNQSWAHDENPARGCRPGPGACQAIVGDLDGAPGPEVVVFAGGLRRVFGERDGRWAEIGALYGEDCAWDQEALREGRFQFRAPAPRRELELAGRRLAFAERQGCRAPDAKTPPAAERCSSPPAAAPTSAPGGRPGCCRSGRSASGRRRPGARPCARRRRKPDRRARRGRRRPWC